MWKSNGQLSIHFVHKIFNFCNFLPIHLFSWPDFREGNCLGQVEKQEISCTKTYGELSTACHHFDYRPLVIARFQKAVSYSLADFVHTFTGLSQ